MRTMILGLALLVAAVLSGCGGTEGFSKREDNVTITGTVARGRAMVGATVTVVCVTGGNHGKTADDGTYSIKIIGATLPCVAQATPSANRLEVYRTLVMGSGRNGNFVAHISPLTELLVALATGLEPGAFISNFNGGIAPSEATVGLALEKLRTLFAGRLDLSGLNPLTDELIAANPSTGLGGNVHDQKIEGLMALLATAQTQLTLVTSAIVTNPGEFDPVKTLLAPAAASCSGLRSGKYRLIQLNEADPLRKTALLEVDAETLTAVDANGATLTLTADTAGSCTFSISRTGATDTLIVSPSGLLAVYTQTTGGARSAALGLPEQLLPVSELAGTWNQARWRPTGSSLTSNLVASIGQATLDNSGVVTASSTCLGLADCTADAGPLPRFATNADGGFDISDGSTPLGRAFLFKNATGKAVFVSLADAGGFSVATRQESLGILPNVFSISSFREFDLHGDGSLSARTDTTVSVTAVAVPTKTVTRSRASDSRVETLVYDAPRAGLRHRAADTCTIADVAVSCPELVQLPLQDSGVTLSLSVGTDPASASFNIAVIKPTN
jgi:hypothetical protein